MENKDKVYNEFLGVNQKELSKENESFMDDKTTRHEQNKILNQKIQRIEKVVYSIEVVVSILLLIEIFRVFKIL